MQEWSTANLWRGTFLMERTALFGLALMLVYVLVAFFRISWQIRSLRAIDSADRRTDGRRRVRIAQLNVWIGVTKSVAVTAPYLGVAGTIVGLLDTYSAGFTGTWRSVMFWLALDESAALLSTAAGLIVAVIAISFYNHSYSRLETLRREFPKEAEHRASHFQSAQKRPLAPRFSTIAIAPAFVIFIAAFALPWSFGPPTGLAVALAPDRCLDASERQIVIHLTQDMGGAKVSINTEPTDWKNLASHLSVIYQERAWQTVYLLADEDVPYQYVADAVDIAETARLDAGKKGSETLGLPVQLMTPRAVTACRLPPVRASDLCRDDERLVGTWRSDWK